MEIKIAEDLYGLGCDLTRIAGYTDVDAQTDGEFVKQAEEYSDLYNNLGSAELVKIAGNLLKLAGERCYDETEEYYEDDIMKIAEDGMGLLEMAEVSYEGDNGYDGYGNHPSNIDKVAELLLNQ